MKKYKTSFSNEELHNALHAKDAEAKAILNDDNKWQKFKENAEDFLEKAEKIPVLGGMIDDIECMVCLVDSYMKKEYKEVPVSSIVSIVAALVYLVSPIDLIPDAIPFIGYLDDAAIILLVLNFGVDKDLDKYRNWNERNRLATLSKLMVAISTEVTTFIQEGLLAALVISNEKIIKLVISDVNEPSEWDEFDIKEMNIPTELFLEYNLASEMDVKSFLTDVMELGQIPMTNNAEKIAYLESEFVDKWDDYIIREE